MTIPPGLGTGTCPERALGSGAGVESGARLQVAAGQILVGTGERARGPPQVQPSACPERWAHSWALPWVPDGSKPTFGFELGSCLTPHREAEMEPHSWRGQHGPECPPRGNTAPRSRLRHAHSTTSGCQQASPNGHSLLPPTPPPQPASLLLGQAFAPGA